MGFPTWTLWGMGVTALGSLLFITLAYIAQSPRLLHRLGLAATRLDLRSRAFTGTALALLLLALGFFAAGVPLEPVATAASQELTPTTATQTAAETEANAAAAAAVGGQEAVVAAPSATPSEPTTGSFDGPPPGQAADESESGLVADSAVTTAAAIAEAATLTPTATATPPPPTATSTPSPTPTMTPTPTLTPTPIEGETAVVTIGSSTYYMKRSPGGQDLVLVGGGDVVIVLTGHANRGGTMWREVSTVDGVVGWLPVEYLDLE